MQRRREPRSGTGSEAPHGHRTVLPIAVQVQLDSVAEAAGAVAAVR